MAPVVLELAKYPEMITPVVAVTAQHRDMLDQVLNLFKPTRLDTHFQPCAHRPSCVTPSLKQHQPVQESQPVVHLLCFSASD